ncbi:MAG: homocysteine S-methyltransferase family protein, partial [Candidatus Omnitrophica bacterium]|nr:homocysteine S-methyltransferase family protein [Candidatus Omnitrophota bacterium]
MDNILEELKKRVLVYDGAMGTVLQARGILKKGMCPESLILDNPSAILKVHEEYVSAGADIIETNTFGANRLKLKEFGLEGKLEKINYKAVELARKAARDKAYVAYGFGPLGKMLEPLGDLSFDAAVGLFREMIEAVARAKPDLILIETMTDIKEAKAAAVAARAVT